MIRLMIGGTQNARRYNSSVHMVYRYSITLWYCLQHNLMVDNSKLWLPRGSVLLPQEGRNFIT